MFERATREWLTSPTMATCRASSGPRAARIVYRSSRHWVGCWWQPSPAFTTWASVAWVTRAAAPTAAWRITITSGSYAESVWTVSRSDSPLSTLEPAAFRLTTSAESRLAASSNDELVRVDASKKTVMMVRPRRVGTFFRSRCMTASKPSAVWRMRSTSSLSRSATEIRWRRGCGFCGG